MLLSVLRPTKQATSSVGARLRPLMYVWQRTEDHTHSNVTTEPREAGRAPISQSKRSGRSVGGATDSSRPITEADSTLLAVDHAATRVSMRVNCVWEGERKTQSANADFIATQTVTVASLGICGVCFRLLKHLSWIINVVGIVLKHLEGKIVVFQL